MTAVATARQVLSLPLGLVSGIVWARLYTPTDVGRFGVLAFVVSLPAMVGDLGLSQAFVRQAPEPDDREMALAASLQLWIAVLAAPAILVAARYGGSSQLAGLAALLYLPTLLGGIALRANVLTVRRLDFARLAALDLVQQVGYIAVLWLLGRSGAGVGGLVGATVASQVLRTAVLVAWYPLFPAALPRLGGLRRVVAAGLPLHLTGIVSGFHIGITNWLGMPLFGPVAVGYLRWSLEMTNKVGAGLAYHIGRVVFPTVALLQHDEARVGRVVCRAVRYNALLVGTPLALLAGLASPVITAVFGDRWAPAGPALQLFALYMVATSILVPLEAAVRVVRPTTWLLGIVGAYFAVEVALALGFAPLAGWLAIPLAHLTATVPLIPLLRRVLPASARPAWRGDVGLPLLALAAAFAASRALASALTPWPALIAGGLAGTAAAGAVIFVLGRGSVWPELVRDLRQLALGPAYGRVPL
jgi:PST family polysaccharide transporter